MEAPHRNIVQKLLKKNSVKGAVLVIAALLFTALFAYQLAPDHSPFANTMIVEMSAQKPGKRQQFLLVPKATAPQKTFAWNRFWNGYPEAYNYIPINSFLFTATGIQVEHFIDEQMQDTLYFSYQELGQPGEVALAQKNIKQNQIKHRTFYLGTDRYGRDILSRLIVGARVSISVGMVAVFLSISIGVVLGLLAGFFGGWVDDVIMYIINLMWAIPTLLLVFAITLTIGKGFWEIFIAIGLTMWVSAARLIRGQVKVIRELDYVKAAQTMGFSYWRIIIKHVLPNVAGPIIVIAASNFATAILIEAGLSFLGIGVQPPQPSWGLMIKEHYNFLLTNRPFLAIVPGLSILLVVFAFNILGNALRDALDVK